MRHNLVRLPRSRHESERPLQEYVGRWGFRARASSVFEVGEGGGDCAFGFGLFEAEPAQAAEDFFGEVGVASVAGVDRGAVGGAVGVLNAERVRRVAGDEEAAHVDCAVVCAAEGDQVGGVVAAAVGAGDDVMDVDVEGVAAAGDLAAVVVAFEDAAADGGRDGGARSWRLRRGAHVGLILA